MITFASCLVDAVRAGRNHTISEYLPYRRPAADDLHETPLRNLLTKTSLGIPNKVIPKRDCVISGSGLTPAMRYYMDVAIHPGSRILDRVFVRYCGNDQRRLMTASAVIDSCYVHEPVASAIALGRDTSYGVPQNARPVV